MVTSGPSPVVVLLMRITRLSGVAAAALTTADGLPVAATQAGHLPKAPAELVELRSATTAAIFGAVDRALPGLGLGHVQAATIETSTYTVHLRGLGDLVLSAVESGADRAELVRELDRVASILARVQKPARRS